LHKDQVRTTKVVDDVVRNVDQVIRASPEVLDIVRANGEAIAIIGGDESGWWRKPGLDGLDNIQCSQRQDAVITKFVANNAGDITERVANSCNGGVL